MKGYSGLKSIRMDLSLTRSVNVRVDVEIVLAVVESTRLASSNIEKRKVFATRNADLTINFDWMSVRNGWKKIHL